MRKCFFIVSVVLLIVNNAYGQAESFSEGWYMIKPGAQVKVVQGNSDDADKNRDWTTFSYSANEVLIAFYYQNDKYYCYDPEGRVVIVKGKNSLHKITSAGRPGHITEDVKVGLDNKLEAGNNVWLTGFNSATKTATVLLVDGQKIEISQTSIQDIKDIYDIMDKLSEWKTVE